MERSHRRARLAGLGFGICAAACWGFGPVATKGALAGFSPEVVGVVRLTTAALFFHALGGRGTRWLPGDPWSALAGVALGVDFLLFNFGVRLTTAAAAALVLNFGQVSNVTLAWALLGETLTARRLLGAALTLVGVVVVDLGSGDPGEGIGSLGGNVLIMLAAIAWSTYAVAQRRAPQTRNISQLLAPIFVVAALVAASSLVLPSAWENPLGSRAILLLVLLASVATIAPYLLYSSAQDLLDLVVMTVVLASIPIFAVALSWLILDEPIGPRIIAGGVFILAGIVVVAVERR